MARARKIRVGDTVMLNCNAINSNGEHVYTGQLGEVRLVPSSHMKANIYVVQTEAGESVVAWAEDFSLYRG